MAQPTKIGSAPGIRRDGTDFDGPTHKDGEWVRWQRGRPRKMWGYRSVTTDIPQVSRGLHAATGNGSIYLHSGSFSKLTQVITDRYGVLQLINDRTPVAGFVASLDNLWQFDIIWDTVSSTNRLIAHAAPSLSNIDSTTDASIFYGPVRTAAVLTDTTVDCSGGIVALHPYLTAFGADGKFAWSVPNKPADFTNTGSGEVRLSGKKLLVGRRVRGSGNGPAGLIWSEDELIRINFTTAGTTWNSDVLAETSIMSTRSIVEFDGIFYWPGVDRFLMFQGVQRELPNNLNFNFFYDNINMQERQKVFGFKNPHWGEIWWCFPKGNATEANHAIILNIREQTWYDTQLPNDGRSAAAYAETYPRPFLTGVKISGSTYKLWQHETGLDEVDGSSVQPIRSFFETGESSMLTTNQPTDQAVKVTRIEPDFIQSGELTVTVKGRQNFRSSVMESDPISIPEVVSEPNEETVPVRETRRLLNFKFESNEVGGDYQAGENLAHIDGGDQRRHS